MKTYTKGGQVRVAETIAQEVALKFDGWRQARPADPEPPEPVLPATEHGPGPTADVTAEPATATDVPAASTKTGARRGKTST